MALSARAASPRCTASMMSACSSHPQALDAAGSKNATSMDVRLTSSCSSRSTNGLSVKAASSRWNSPDSRIDAAVAIQFKEHMRDLVKAALDAGLVDKLGDIAALRQELAALPGPVLRPDDLAAALPPEAQSAPSPAASAPPPGDFQLPVQGRTLIGFGARRESGLASTGLTLAAAQGAQVVAPARGRVAFAGVYRGFGRIVIIEHAGGWTSLVTGLEQVGVAVGDNVIGGSPVGRASGAAQPVTIELRRGGKPVNPLEYLR